MKHINLIPVKTESELDSTAIALVNRCAELFNQLRQQERKYGSDSAPANIARSRWSSLYTLVRDLNLNAPYLNCVISNRYI